jgi:hypothetical protein
MMYPFWAAEYSRICEGVTCVLLPGVAVATGMFPLRLQAAISPKKQVIRKTLREIMMLPPHGSL